jgi:hypothetical protein
MSCILCRKETNLQTLFPESTLTFPTFARKVAPLPLHPLPSPLPSLIMMNIFEGTIRREIK